MKCILIPKLIKFLVGMLKLNTILRPSYWNDPEWRSYMEDELKINGLYNLHRKQWEFTQTIYGLAKLGYIKEENLALDVGAGTERLLFYLANKLKKVVGIDLYDFDERGKFPGAAQVEMLTNPSKYAPFPYREDHLEIKKMNANHLEFDDNTFDIVFSVSSIEHFDGHNGSRESMVEISRVLKHGGVAAITTECILNGIKHSSNFTPEELDEFLIKPSGLELVEPIDYDTTELEPYIKNPLEVPVKGRFPHFVLIHKNKNDIWTSVTFFLKKK